MAKNNKKKLFAQRLVCSRMNFLYQAAHLMAEGSHNTLGAYYGKLCRNVGTKSMMHMAPAMKRALCKRCSLPLIPGVNTSLTVPQAKEQRAEPKAGKKKRHRRQRSKKRAVEKTESQPKESTVDEHTPLQLECPLCQGRRSFVVDSQRECWLEQPQALVEVLDIEAEEEEGRQTKAPPSAQPCVQPSHSDKSSQLIASVSAVEPSGAR
ncbi:ribonuclease P protein subunit p21 [Drosophila obscura]|uniref:ribonuclease P protein subunit p21 n=1 Tax=Drosophila obscura TaxID=7282 RepID=UPI000BA13E3E|nr:ribonuclease P protein subunit p21 [Drosophila obscura]